MDEVVALLAGFWWGLLLAAALAFIPAAIASSKGRNLAAWWLYGFLLLIVAIPHSLLMSNKRARVCPFCAEKIMNDATVCRYCGNEQTEDIVRGGLGCSGWLLLGLIIVLAAFLIYFYVTRPQ